jgi:hypothetical protein
MSIQNSVWNTVSLDFLNAAATYAGRLIHESRMMDILYRSFPDAPIVDSEQE